jgi:type IX secretion system PorP/SprF family membrane protein
MNIFYANCLKLFVVFSFCPSIIFAQEAPVYLKHNTYEQFINPAITGRDRYTYLNLSNRKNWIGTRYSPSITAIGASFRLGTFNFYTPTKMLNKTRLLSKNRMGFGGLVMHEQNGPLETIYSSATYSYFLPLDKSSMTELSFGLLGQVMHYSINQNLLDPNEPGDPALLNINHQPWVADAGFGIYFHTKQFQIGASSNELFQTGSTLDDANFYKNRRDYFFQSGYKFFMHYCDLEPFIYAAKIDNDPLYYYTQLKAYYKNYNWFAVAYKSTRSLVLSIGIRINRMQLGYAYEQSMNHLGTYYAGINEIMIGYNIGFFEPEGIRKTVRKN